MIPPVTPAQWIALTVGLEAEGEPWEGQLAVAWSIVHRARRQHRSISDTLFDPYDYSCWSTENPRRAVIDRIMADAALWTACGNAAVAALTGTGPDPSHGGDHYLNVEATKRARGDGRLPAWAEDPQCPGAPDPVKVTAQVGRHTFLRLL